MEKNYFGAIEFGSQYNSVVVLSYHNNKIDVVASARVHSDGFYDGHIVDYDAFDASLDLTIQEVYDKYHIKLDEVILVLPNNNHKVYSATVTNKVLTERQIISKLQINAIRNQIRSAKINDDEVLVEEIPTLYTLDGDRSLRSDPIDYQSSFLTIKSNVHTLPKDIFNSLKNAIESKNIKVIGYYLNCSSGAFATKKEYELEDESIFINIGQEVTTLCSYKKSLLLDSRKINFGVETLIKHLAKTLQVSVTEATTLFETYFIANVDYASDIVFDEQRNLFEKRISGIVLNRLTNGIKEILDECDKLALDSKFSDDCTYLLAGWLNDYEFFYDQFSNCTSKIVKERNIDVIGLNYQSYLNCYGAILLFIDRNKQYIIKRFEVDDNLELNKEIESQSKKIETENNTTSGKFKDIFDD